MDRGALLLIPLLASREILRGRERKRCRFSHPITHELNAGAHAEEHVNCWGTCSDRSVGEGGKGGKGETLREERKQHRSGASNSRQRREGEQSRKEKREMKVV